MINEYVEIVKYYDNLLTSGYFDFDALANTLYNLLGARRKVLDIGVGTGLLTEKMLSRANYKIVGVDFSMAAPPAQRYRECWKLPRKDWRMWSLFVKILRNLKRRRSLMRSFQLEV
ncbi:MAG: class I SAM-dependent methyltransferase [Hormoscilla sp. GM7CHS1pb]|nr:class I SAM-dependent methyltransferase [Hormoscilla sp. GM7CHS1pb]